MYGYTNKGFFVEVGKFINSLHFLSPEYLPTGHRFEIKIFKRKKTHA